MDVDARRYESTNGRCRYESTNGRRWLSLNQPMGDADRRYESSRQY